MLVAFTDIPEFIMSLGKAVVLGLMLSLSPAADSVGLAGRDGEPGNLNYLALGASDAAGVGAYPLTRGYVFKIADALAVRGEPVGLYNLGIPGATVIEIQAALEVFLITRQQIDLVTIWVGSNDLIQGLAISEFAQGLRSILSQLRARTNAFIVIANLVDLTRLPRFVEKPDADVTAARVAAFNQIIRNEAARFRVAVLNLFALVDPNRDAITAIDGFHPNNRGHQRLASLFLGLIVPHLRTQPEKNLLLVKSRDLSF
jgi:acyl-CoA thioesterase I